MKKTGISLPEKPLIPDGIFWAGIFVICVVTRMLSTIYYIEDPDSLRFALSVLDYDVANLQPHFPAYPVFCFVAKGFFLMLGKYSLAFSMVGAISTFAIIYFSYRSAKILWKDSSLYIISALIFLNPLIWLMANRFMPETMGLAMVCLVWFLFLKRESIDASNSKIDKTGICIFLVAGILIGTRLSYLPAIALPVLWINIRTSWKTRLQFSLAFIFALLLWLIPLIADTGWEELIASASRHTTGHFNEFGGTVSSNPDWLPRLSSFFTHLWADGLGGYMPGRHWITIGFSVFLVGGLLSGLLSVFHSEASKIAVRILLLSILAYALWVFFYQNIIYKSRHLLPLIPFVLVLAGWGIQRWIELIGKWGFAIIVIGFGLNTALTFKLVSQHKSPSAVAQLKNFLGKTNENIDLIIAPDLMIYFLKKQGINLPFHEINDPPSDLDRRVEAGEQIIIIANLAVYQNLVLNPIQTFQHNPYINRMWSTLVMSEFVSTENPKDE